MEPALTVIRDVTRKECPWLDNDIVAGTKVFAYWGCTYGCISPSGRAVSLEQGKEPFMEIPVDALRADGE